MESKGKNSSSPLVPMRRHLVTLSDAAFQQIAAEVHLTDSTFADMLDAIVRAYYCFDSTPPAPKVGILGVYLGKLS